MNRQKQDRDRQGQTEADNSTEKKQPSPAAACRCLSPSGVVCRCLSVKAIAASLTTAIRSAGEIYAALELERERMNKVERLGVVTPARVIEMRQRITDMRGTLNHVTKHLRQLELELEQLKRCGRRG